MSKQVLQNIMIVRKKVKVKLHDQVKVTLIMKVIVLRKVKVTLKIKSEIKRAEDDS